MKQVGPAEPVPGTWLTPREAAKLLGKGRDTLIRLAARGVLYAIRAGTSKRSHRRYAETVIRVLLAEGPEAAAVLTKKLTEAAACAPS